jgi:hypothetical protein
MGRVPRELGVSAPLVFEEEQRDKGMMDATTRG